MVPAICDSCGFTVSQTATPAIDAKLEQNHMRIVVIISIVVLVGFCNLVSWGSYTFEMRMLQLRDLVGMSSVASLDRMAAICEELKKFNCIEYAYSRQAKIEPKMTIRYAQYQMTRHKWKEAALTLKGYVARKGADPKAYGLYAQALSEAGQIDEAIKYFEYAIHRTRATQDVIQAYVKHLSRNRRFDQALSVILRYRKAKPNFMESEYRIIMAMRSSVNDRMVAGKRASN